MFLSDGRLGNQAFQYAYLNSIKNKNETVLCFDMKEFTSTFELENHDFVFVKLEKFSRLFFIKIIIPLILLFSKIKLLSTYEQVRVNGVPQGKVKVSKGFLPLKYVKTGFFQSEKLFSEEKIDFVIKNEFKEQAEQILSQLPAGNKVFVHIRRGDYIGEFYNGERGIELPASYYRDAIKLINDSIENPFFVFLSDDPGYVRDVFKDIQNKYISHNDMKVDFAMMGLCNYGVCSNSSFSWWASFFSKGKQLMIFPKYWYGWKSKTDSHPDIYPSWAHVIDI
jgi:hypothetical protein